MNKLPHPFFVEFIGVPGSGKSTLSHYVTNKLREEGLLFYTPTYKINEDFSLYGRLFYKLFYSTTNVLGNLNSVYKYIEYIRYHNINFKLLINWFYVNGVSEKYSKRKAITLYDQGLIQALWSFILSESKETAAFFQNLLLNGYPNVKCLIVCVEANDEVVKSRLSQRISNNSRVGTDRNAQFNVNEALQSYLKIIKTVNSLVDSRSGFSKLTLINEKQADLEKNVKTIINEIKIDI